MVLEEAVLNFEGVKVKIQPCFKGKGILQQVKIEIDAPNLQLYEGGNFRYDTGKGIIIDLFFSGITASPNCQPELAEKMNEYRAKTGKFIFEMIALKQFVLP